MQPIDTSLDFIVDKPRFKTERPFAIHIGEDQADKFAPDDPALNTIDMKKEPVTVYDLRTLNDVALDGYGFQTSDCNFTPFPDLDKVTEDQVELYQVETEELLKESLGAEKVICYDYRVSKYAPLAMLLLTSLAPSQWSCLYGWPSGEHERSAASRPAPERRSQYART